MYVAVILVNSGGLSWQMSQLYDTVELAINHCTDHATVIGTIAVTVDLL